MFDTYKDILRDWPHLGRKGSETILPPTLHCVLFTINRTLRTEVFHAQLRFTHKLIYIYVTGNLSDPSMFKIPRQFEICMSNAPGNL